jgi:hypothetical protein
MSHLSSFPFLKTAHLDFSTSLPAPLDILMAPFDCSEFKKRLLFPVWTVKIAQQSVLIATYTAAFYWLDINSTLIHGAVLV